MPNIRPSAYLRNHYNEVSEFCHSRMEPVFITKNGHGDLAVMSIEAYEKFCGRYELYSLIDEGFEDIKKGNHSNFDNFMEEFWQEVEDDK
ncbi:MAG: type II toxin-antitoxin system Phd/YefM family antitoxin [Oscillospiraceae bacterium]|nr:type II toxin-antitoxin system Phd/YefM family antitoxin [Oscillospiraceae bacterium]